MASGYPAWTPHNPSRSKPLMSSATRYPSSQTTPLPTSSLMSAAARRTGSASSATRSTNRPGSTNVDDMEVSDVQTVRDFAMDSTDIESQIYLSVVWQAGQLGMAYYDLDNLQIYLMMDTMETDDFSLLKRALRQLQPENIITSSKQDERLVKTLKEAVSALFEDPSDGGKQSEVLQFLPSVQFSLEISKRRILSLSFPSIPDHYNDSERTLYMSSLVPFECSAMVRAAGGLIKYLEKMRVGIELEDSETRVPVLGLQIFSLDDQMILDDTAYSALQIFHREAHPSVYKAGCSNSAKEGLSLFGILNRCKSQLGSRMLRLWFLRPLKNQTILKQRHDAISFFTNANNIEVLTTLSDCVRYIKNVPRILSRMSQSQASTGDWQTLYKTVYHAICIGDTCRAQPQGIDIFRKISQSFSVDLHRIVTLITKIVDFDESASQNRFVVKPNVDADLDKKKRFYNGLPDFMSKVAREELNKLSDDITECNVIYLPQIGYLLAIPGSDKTEEDFDIPGMEFKFCSNGMLHYRNARTRELDNLFGDTLCDITDMETSIMHRLQNIILEHSKVILDVMEHVAELDCLISLTTCAREFSYVRPELVKDFVIDIQAGRHPLQELCCSPYVPNDIQSGDDHGKIKVMTGPNACGKSCYLKQVGLIVYMAHIGSFVPAEKATVGPVDRIFTRIKSLDSVSVGLSTFMLDINQMSEALRSATSQSLVVVDEFGKGTETTDGLSLLTACLKHWLALGDECPHVLICTHFHSIIHHRLLPDANQLKYLTMDCMHNGEELVFLYQLVEGHTASSYALHVATQAGLPQTIIQRSSEVSELLQHSKPVHRVDSASADTQYKRCKMIVDRFLQLDIKNDDLISFLQDFVLPTSKGQN
ncbi:mutS protein homolog 5-like [Gigantopelta aegis]|uniref:mutS protein homolog 5-like n=1 Tax=Gigantopelta aegis TaxID=1735272 RepID=UPI001B88A351|nr:mutS protein homolog 5-like [Gigantopelta aegis]XP_041360062.1 mutS protein homolog 5-like [Gigantopelta aegis]